MRRVVRAGFSERQALEKGRPIERAHKPYHVKRWLSPLMLAALFCCLCLLGICCVTDEAYADLNSISPVPGQAEDISGDYVLSFSNNVAANSVFGYNQGCITLSGGPGTCTVSRTYVGEAPTDTNPDSEFRRQKLYVRLSGLSYSTTYTLTISGIRTQGGNTFGTSQFVFRTMPDQNPPPKEEPLTPANPDTALIGGGGNGGQGGDATYGVGGGGTGTEVPDVSKAAGTGGGGVYTLGEPGLRPGRAVEPQESKVLSIPVQLVIVLGSLIAGVLVYAMVKRKVAWNRRLKA